MRVAEIMYHPRPDSAGSWPDEEYEYIELVNTSQSQAVELAGMAFDQGVSFTFPAMQLDAGQRPVLVRNRAAFEYRYGSGIQIAGQYGGTPEDYKLANAGESLRLRDATGGVIHHFTYGDDWVAGTDGQGYSLTAVDLAADPQRWNEPSHWRSSTDVDGSPGEPDEERLLPGDANQDGVFDGRDSPILCWGRASIARVGRRRFPRGTGTGTACSTSWTS